MEGRRRVAIGVVLAIVILIGGARPATAQDRVFVGSREIGALGHFGADLGPAPTVLRYPRFGGDRYVHVPGTGVIDLRTGSTISLPQGFAVAYDRARPRVYLGRDDGIWSVDVSTSWSVLVLPVSVAGLTTCAHATSADVLLCAFARPDGQHDIVRPGLAGPVLVSTVRFADAFSENWVVTPDATRVYLPHCARPAVSTPPGPCLERDIAMVDVATGAVTTASAFDALSPLSKLVWDEAHDRLFTVGTRIDVFNRDLVPIGSAATGGRCRDLAVSPHTGRIYLNVYDYYFSASWATLGAYDAATLRALSPGETRTTNAACDVAVLTAPGRPRDVQARVSGRDVTLTWTNIGASSFMLDVGFAPGRSALSLFLGPTPHATFTNVPPGTYYLRLRGGNEHGGGRPSPEIAVTIR